ncbi:MAG: GlgB N-terminal domain-containing protein [Beijerinckiaceae bacterium]
MSVARQHIAALDAESLAALERGAHAEPFSVLGVQSAAGGRMLRVNAPGAWRVEARARSDRSILAVLDQSQTPGLFATPFDANAPYLLRIFWPGRVDEHEDPYSFPPAIPEADLRALCHSEMRGAGDILGAHAAVLEGVPGVRFAVFAPQAASVAVAGSFNGWSDRRHPMGRRSGSHIWELFVPRIGAGVRYAFAIREREDREAALVVDPFAREIERDPRPAGIVAEPMRRAWRDGRFLAIRRARRDCAPPAAIYRIVPELWLSREGRVAGWRALGERLPPFIAALGFTHVQVGQARKDAAAGAGAAWLFAPPPELGPAHDFAAFVDACHDAGIGVIVEWDAPAAFAEARAGEPRLVENILADSAMHWLGMYHIDGLSMKGSAADSTLQARLRDAIEESAPGAVLILEDAQAPDAGLATAWRPDAIAAAFNGDGLSLQRESAARLERALLPVTPDTLSSFAPADAGDPLALLRAVYAFAWLTPGMKLMHMGAELGQHRWPDGAVAWDILDDPGGLRFLRLIRDLNSTLRSEAPIRLTTRVSQLVTWLPAAPPVVAYVRSGEAAAPLLVAMNRGGEARGLQLEVPCRGRWRELLNTDSRHYGGGDVGNFGGADAFEDPHRPGTFLLDITLPPRGTIIFRNET